MSDDLPPRCLCSPQVYQDKHKTCLHCASTCQPCKMMKIHLPTNAKTAEECQAAFQERQQWSGWTEAQWEKHKQVAALMEVATSVNARNNNNRIVAQTYWRKARFLHMQLGLNDGSLSHLAALQKFYFLNEQEGNICYQRTSQDPKNCQSLLTVPCSSTQLLMPCQT